MSAPSEPVGEPFGGCRCPVRGHGLVRQCPCPVESIAEREHPRCDQPHVCAGDGRVALCGLEQLHEARFAFGEASLEEPHIAECPPRRQ